MPRHMENEVIGDSQAWLIEDKLCLTNSVAFYDGVIVQVLEGRMTDVINLDLCKACNKVLHNIHISNWKDMDLMDGPLSDKKVAEWSHLKSCSQQLNIQVENIDK